jgi:hypothetical protein
MVDKPAHLPPYLPKVSVVFTLGKLVIRVITHLGW